MTAIGLYVHRDGVCVFSDGIAYDKEGIVREIHSKQYVLTACNTVMVGSGSGPALELLRNSIECEAALPSQFDQIEARMSDWCRSVEGRMREIWGKPPVFLILFGGWSEIRQAWCGRFIANQPMRDMDGAATEPMAVVEIVAFSKPAPTEDALRCQGLPATDPWSAFQTMPPSEFGTRMILAQRASPMFLHHGGSLEGYGVGGFVEYTDLRRDSSETKILVRWSDEIGCLADPSCDVPWCFSSSANAEPTP